MIRHKIFCLITAIILLFVQCGSRKQRNNIAKNDKISTAVAVDTGRNQDQGDSPISEKTLVIAGILDSSGNTLLSIQKPVLYSRPANSSKISIQKGRYRVAVQYTNKDSVVVYFDGLVAGDRNEAPLQHGFFEVEIPVKYRIASIKIIEVNSKKVLKEFTPDDIEKR